MDLPKALKLIKKSLKGDAVEGAHFKIQCEERELNPFEVRAICKKNVVLGILDQDNGRYRVTFKNTAEKDLNIVVQLVNKKVRLVTVFPIGVERRKR